MEILVKGENIDGKESECLGSQLADLIEAIAPALPGVIWLSGDVDTTRGVIAPFSDALECIEIGPSDVLIALSRTVHQYLQGVFIAAKPEDVGSIRGQEVYTEDDYYLTFEQSVLEIRAFDTTCFLVYTRDQALAELFLKRFQGKAGPERFRDSREEC